MTRLHEVLQAIDRWNAQDPRGYEGPYSQKMTEWVLKLEPNPSEALQIAARGQHIGRWTLPRQQYPDDRGGYLRWREELKRFHAKTVGELMKEKGYDDTVIERVRRIILKKDIHGDPETQVIEDALCLVFLEQQFDALRQQEGDDKMVDILRKTWNKMGEKGRVAAQAIPLSPKEKALLKQALEPQ